MSLAYRMEFLTPEEAGKQDPFGGNGIKIDLPYGMNKEAAVHALAVLYPGVPAVAWAGHAWVDQRGLPPGTTVPPQALNGACPAAE